ncbi:MAG: DUF5615 family PIN-like protein [Pirellulales bacterium]
MLAFYMDHQLSVHITRGLRNRGVDVLTAYEDGAAEVADDELLTRATALGRVLVTHDKGFLRLVAERQQMRIPFDGIVFVAQQSLQVGHTIEYLELIANVMNTEDMLNRVEHVPRNR